MIDYIMMSTSLAKECQQHNNEEQSRRVKSKKESDHNAILVNLKINEARKPEYLEKWKLDNKEGWAQFNATLTNMDNKGEILEKDYEEIGRTIRNLVKQIIGKQKIKIDERQKPKSRALAGIRGKKTIKGLKKCVKQKHPKDKILEKKGTNKHKEP